MDWMCGCVSEFIECMWKKNIIIDRMCRRNWSGDGLLAEIIIHFVSTELSSMGKELNLFGQSGQFIFIFTISGRHF